MIQRPKLSITQDELARLRFERSTERAIAYKQLLKLPGFTVICYFRDEDYGHFWVFDGRTYVGGYAPTQLGYTTIRGPGFNYRLAWPDVGDDLNAICRFLGLVDEYKRRYRLPELRKRRW